MDKKLNYKTVGVLSIIYAISPILSLFSGSSGVIQIFLMVIFPYILMRLRDFIIYKFDYKKVSIFFNIEIFLIILNLILMTLGITVIDIFDINHRYGNGFVQFLSLLLTLKGIAFMLIGIVLMRKYHEFDAILKTVAICIFLFGFQTIVASSIGIWPRLLIILSKTYSMVILNCLKALLFIMQLVMFGLIGYAFIKNRESKKENFAGSN
jgi:hypothetical protein